MNKDSRVIIITGGNRGIGFALLERLIKHSDHPTLVFTARAESACREAAEKLLAKEPNYKDSLHYHSLEITDDSSVNKFVEWLKSTIGKIDVLVNNAGVMEKDDEKAFSIFGAPGADKYYPALEWVDQAITTNYDATRKLTEKLLPLITADGKVINVASSLGFWSTQGEVLYEILKKPDFGEKDFDEIKSKFINGVKNKQLEGMTRSPYKVAKALLIAYTHHILPKQLKGDQQCYVLCPGWCKTDLGGSNAPMTADDGADTMEYLINLPYKFDKDLSGQFFKERKVVDLHFKYDPKAYKDEKTANKKE